MPITDKQLVALHNLADKEAGQAVDWINIADARVLTELGFARRTRGGWEITSEGLARVKAGASGPTLVDQGEVIALPPAPSSNDQ